MPDDDAPRRRDPEHEHQTDDTRNRQSDAGATGPAPGGRCCDVSSQLSQCDRPRSYAGNFPLR